MESSNLEPVDIQSYEEFLKFDAFENTSMQSVMSVKEASDIVVNNNGTLDQLFTNIDIHVEAIGRGFNAAS